MFIGVDIGTTNVKAVAMSDDGVLCASAERRNETLSPQAGWQEQDPEMLFQNVLSVLTEVVHHNGVVRHPESVQGIAFSAAMHGLVAVDVAGRPLTNVWLWSDLRADAVARDLRKPEGLGSDLYQRTGVPVHPMSPLCKLIWMRDHLPEVFQSAHKFLGIKDFIWHRLTGKFEIDVACGSATGLMNIWRNEWDAGALALAGIAAEQLPVLVAPVQLSGSSKLPESSISSKLSGSLELPESCIGASDGALANLGSGATAAGHLAVTIGTSAAIRCVAEMPHTDSLMRTFCYRLDESHCIIGGASNNGTNVLEWLRTVVFRSADSPEAFTKQAIEISPGADGLVFLPYLLGERAPLWDAGAHGAFLGLTAQHRQAHFVRAAMEGVLYNLKMIAEGMREQSPIHMLYASGGFSQNTAWVQMLADIFQVPVMVSHSGIDASVLGAIQIGRKAMGLVQMDQNEPHSLIQPDQKRASAYVEAFHRFRQLLKDSLATI